jgi:hypothetical protein
VHGDQDPTTCHDAGSKGLGEGEGDTVGLTEGLGDGDTVDVGLLLRVMLMEGVVEGVRDVVGVWDALQPARTGALAPVNTEYPIERWLLP